MRVTFRDSPTDETATGERPAAIATEWAARPRLLLAASALVVIAIACGAAGASGWFLYLDDQLITNNTVLRSWSGLSAIWGQPQYLPKLAPVSLTALLVQYQAFHDHAIGYRVMNLLLHAMNVLLLWTLLRRLDLRRTSLAVWAAAALFAAHPVVVDAIDWVSQQPLLLCASFFLSALIVYFQFCGLNPSPLDDAAFDPVVELPQRRGLLYAMAAVLFGASLLCDVSAVSWPLVVGIAIWWKRGRLTRRELMALAPLVLISAGWLAAVAHVEWQHRGARGADFPATLQRFQLAGMTLWFYAFRAVAPLRTSFAYSRWNLSADAIWQYLPTLAALAALAGLFLARRKLGRAPFALAAIYAALLLPFMGLINFDWMRQSWVADHLQYLALPVPIAGIVMLIAWTRWRTPALAGPALTVVATVLLLVLSIARAANYRDQQKLWNSVLARNPDSTRALNGLGRLALDDRNDAVTAMSHFLAALRIYPEDIPAHMNIARAYMLEGQWTKAIGEYHKVLSLRPGDDEARMGLALALSSHGEDAWAMNEYRQIIQADPRNAPAHNNLGLLLAGRGEWEEAISSYRRSIQVDPRFVPARINLANLLYQRALADNDTTKLEEAADQLVRVTKIDPGSYEAHYNIGSILGMTARLLENEKDRAGAEQHYAEATKFYRRAVRLRPDSADAWRGLGFVLARQSRGQTRERALELLNESVGCFRRAQRIAPDDAQASLGVRLSEADRDAASRLSPGARFLPPATTAEGDRRH